MNKDIVVNVVDGEKKKRKVKERVLEIRKNGTDSKTIRITSAKINLALIFLKLLFKTDQDFLNYQKFSTLMSLT